LNNKFPKRTTFPDGIYHLAPAQQTMDFAQVTWSLCRFKQLRNLFLETSIQVCENIYSRDQATRSTWALGRQFLISAGHAFMGDQLACAGFEFPANTPFIAKGAANFLVLAGFREARKEVPVRKENITKERLGSEKRGSTP
jgi:hypothetical protein